MKLLGVSLLVLASLAAAASSADPAERFSLARGGRALVTLTAVGAARPIADETAAYLQRLTGTRFTVRSRASGRGGEIHFSISPAGARRPEEGEWYRFRKVGSRLTLEAGRPRALRYAAADLLERCGVRFLAPAFDFYGGASEFVPARPDLQIDVPSGERRAAAMPFRKIYVEEGRSHTLANLRQLVEWMPRGRYNTLVVPVDYQGRGEVRWDNWRKELAPLLQKLDLIIEVGGHGYQNFLNAEMEGGRLFREHPDWFGVDQQGRRSRRPNQVFCTSNRSAVDYVTQQFLAYVKQRPEIQIFDFWPPDGARWCACDSCRDLGSPSNRQALLLNHVLGSVRKAKLPLRLECLAYQTSIFPPETAVLDPGVLVDYCPINQNFDEPMESLTGGWNRRYLRGVRAWRGAFEGDISLYSYYRKYAWRSLPVIIPGSIGREVALYRDIPLQGVSIYGEPGDWSTYELNHYTLARAAWNGRERIDDLVGDFCRARYGEIAPEARRLTETMGEAVRTFGNIPHASIKPATEIQAAHAELERTAAVFRGRAAALPASPPAVASAARRLLLMTEYALRDLELQQIRASGAGAAELNQEVRELTDFLKDHAGEGTVVQHSRLSESRLQTAYAPLK